MHTMLHFLLLVIPGVMVNASRIKVSASLRQHNPCFDADVVDKIANNVVEKEIKAQNLTGCLDLNTASLNALTSINGIGRSTAHEIRALGCFENIEDIVEEFRGSQNFKTIRDLTLGSKPKLCVKAPCESSADCVDLNSASIGELSALKGIGKSTAYKIREGRCYDDINDFKDTFKALDNWDMLEALIESGELCVDSACEDYEDDEEDDEPLAVDTDSRASSAPKWSLDQCDEKKKVPPVRTVEDSYHSSKVIKEMIFALYIPRKRKPLFDFVQATPGRRKKCLESFPSEITTSSDRKTFDGSVGVCVLVKPRGQEELAMEYSEYNTVRHTPNFVAYKLRNIPQRYTSSQCRVSWMTVCPKFRKGTKLKLMEDRCQGLVDFHFGPKAVSRRSCPVADPACTASVNTRGHMRPVSHTAWSKEMCSATMSFVNVVPTRNDPHRNPFDGRQWARREGHLIRYLEILKDSLPAVWVVVGISKESDGKVTSQRQVGGYPNSVDVPSFLWTAVYDPSVSKATGWLCRNGLSPNDECFCADKLSVRDLEMRVGYRIFPQLERMPGLNLSSGSHDSFWEGLYEDE